jgi:NADH-quinone oxidoreductase subunit H
VIWSGLAAPLLVILCTLVLGSYLLEFVHGKTGAWLAGGRSYAFFTPLYRIALKLRQQSITTERPDDLNRLLAPALFLGLAAMGLSVVPWSGDFIPADLSTGIVLWGAVEVLATVVIFLYGWSANAHFPLLAGYRYVSLGLSYMLVSMFVLIGVALPAESLRISAVVDSQRELWNVIRQPLGLPLFLVVGLGLTFWGPLNFASSKDLASGVSSDTSGPAYLLWEFARRSMLVAFSFMAASAFLGGWLGPILPGPLWLILKAMAVLAVLLLVGRLLPKISADGFISLAWVVLLPLAFVDLIWAGVLALW